LPAARESVVASSAQRALSLNLDDPAQAREAVALLCAVLAKVHGHNVAVTVKAWSAAHLNDRFLVADEDIVALVNEWHFCNLSVHPDITSRGWYASAERYVQILLEKLQERYPGVHFSVRWQETEAIYAEVSS
jgi:hypothetical protein